MQEDLRIIHSTLSQIPYWIDCGTLLFLIREGKLDPEDIDISVLEDNLTEIIKLLPEFIDKGFKIHAIYSHPTIGITEISFRRDGRAFDIFIRRKVGKHHYGVSKYDDYVYWKTPVVEELDIIEFDGLLLPVPHNPEDYLTYYYGDWRTPDQNWHWSKAPCICEEIC